jgi:hypothetical protein
MAGNTDAGARILAAQARHCEHLADELAAARTAHAPAAELADLEAQELAARKRYQELAVDMPGQTRGGAAHTPARGRRPWWRIW